jgi:hypothetical protein
MSFSALSASSALSAFGTSAVLAGIPAGELGVLSSTFGRIRAPILVAQCKTMATAPYGSGA